MAKSLSTLKSRTPGVLLCAGLGIAAIAISNLIIIPVMLLAIIAGILLHRLDSLPLLTDGINWTSRSVLYFGVALMGLRIDLRDLLQTGVAAPVIVIAILAATVLIGYGIARLLGQSRSFSLLMSGAVGICGASAAVAICGALEDSKSRNYELAITIAVITILSTLAMLFYPFIALSLGLNNLASGVFMGGSIHNVSQAVGAGYTISDETGDITVLLKLIRVSALLPIVFLITLFSGKRAASGHGTLSGKILAYFPPFLIAFFVLAILSCLSLIPASITQSGNIIAEFCLVISLVAIGIKTNIQDVLNVGLKPLLAMTLTTIIMAFMALAAAYMLMSL